MSKSVWWSEFWSARIRTACLMALVFAQFEDRWGPFGGVLALFMCGLWVCLPGFVAEGPQGKTLFPKERQMPETAPNDQQSKEDGSENP